MRQQNEEINMEHYLTPKQVAAKLQVTVDTLKYWRKRDVLPGYKIGGVVRYRKIDIEKTLKNGSNG